MNYTKYFFRYPKYTNMWKEDFYMNSMKGFLLAGLLIWSLLICPACANLDPSVAKEYRDAGADSLNYDPQIQSLSNLDKAKYAFEAYCNWLESNNIPVNSDLIGRAKNMGADWTCADHGLKLQEFFEGAGITAPHIFVKAISDSLNPLNVNSDHGALAIIDGGQVYFFDPWQLAVQNEKDGLTAYSKAKASKWNGMTADDWETEMGKQDYKRFSFSDGGVDEKSLHKLLKDSKLIGTIVWGIKRPFPNSEKGTIEEVYSFSIHTNVKGIPKDAKLDWSYGDGGTDTGKKLDELVTHKYDSAGTYTVSVTASWLGDWSTETTTQITIAKAPNLTANSIILLFDASSSMADNNKIDNAKTAAKNFLNNQVQAGDEVALIVFYDCSSIVVEVPFTTDKLALISKIDAIEPNSATPIYAAMAFAKEYMAENAHGATKKIIQFTDGEETCGGGPQ
jgi:hypothetical protein